MTHFDQAVKSDIGNKSRNLSNKHREKKTPQKKRKKLKCWETYKELSRWEEHACVIEESEMWGEIFLRLGNWKQLNVLEKNSETLCVAGCKKGRGRWFIESKNELVLCQGPIISVPFTLCHSSVSLLYVLISANLFPKRNMPRLVQCPSLHSPLLLLEESCCPYSTPQSHTYKTMTSCLVGLKWQTEIIRFLQEHLDLVLKLSCYLITVCSLEN